MDNIVTLNENELREEFARLGDQFEKVRQAAIEEKRDLSADEKERCHNLLNMRQAIKEENELREAKADGDKWAEETRALVSQGTTNTSANATDEMQQFRAGLTSRADEVQIRALSTGATPGSYWVPEEYEAGVIAMKRNAGVMRKLCRVETRGNDVRVTYETGFGVCGVVAETGNVNTAAVGHDPQGEQITFGAHTLFHYIPISNNQLEDSNFDVIAYLQECTAKAGGTLEDEYVIRGLGTTVTPNEPVGIDTDITNIYGTSNTTLATDDIILAKHTNLNSSYWAASSILVAPSTLGTLATARTDAVSSGDSKGSYLWQYQPALIQGEPDRFNGLPIYTCTACETSAYAAYIGDFDYVRIVDRRKMTLQILRETLALTQQTGYLSTWRMDSKICQPNAIVAIELGASS